MKRFLTKRFLASGLVLTAVLAFAGTCNIENFGLSNVNGAAVFGGEIHNNSGANILQHDMLVAFIGTSNNVLETTTATPCLRTLPSGGVDYFSSQSSFPWSQVTAALARINFDSTFQVGTPATGSGTISNLSIHQTNYTLTVSGTFRNTDSTTLSAPNACAVVYSTTGDVMVVGLQSLGALASNQSETFGFSVQARLNDVVSHVDVYVDGLKNGVPISPISDLDNTVGVGGTMLAFTSQPSGSSPTVPFPSQPVVAVENSDATIATTSSAPVSLSITSGTGDASAFLSCSSGTTVNAVNGYAYFSGCFINVSSGTYYSLTATSPGLSSAVSTSFLISPATVTPTFTPTFTPTTTPTPTVTPTATSTP